MTAEAFASLSLLDRIVRVFSLETWAKLASVGSFVTSVLAVVLAFMGARTFQRMLARLEQLAPSETSSEDGSTVLPRSATDVSSPLSTASQKRLYRLAQSVFIGIGVLMLASALLVGTALLIITELKTSPLSPTGGNIPQEETKCTPGGPYGGGSCTSYQRWTLSPATDKIETTYHRSGNQATKGTVSFLLLRHKGCDGRAEIAWKLMAGPIVLNEGKESSATRGDGGKVRTEVPAGQELGFVAERVDNEDCVVTLELVDFEFTED
jgi:hypothetical protein